MREILQAIIGRDFGNPTLFVKLVSSFCACEDVNLIINDSHPPYPAKNFTRDEVVALRNYLNRVIDGYDESVAIKEENYV